MSRPSGGRLSSRMQLRRVPHLPAGGGGPCRDKMEIDDGQWSESDSGVGLGFRQPDQVLACPFYKYNSMRYMSCLGLQLKRPRDVKQHLNRRHLQPKYCPVCGKTFGDSSSWKFHISDRNCVCPPNGFVVDGVTEEHGKALSRRAHHSLGKRGQWFSIWETLFPESPKPSSPYVSTYVEESVSMLHDYWLLYRDTIVAELDHPGSTVEDRNMRAVVLGSRIVESLFSRFRASCRYAADLDPSNSTFPDTSITLLPSQVNGASQSPNDLQHQQYASSQRSSNGGTTTWDIPSPQHLNAPSFILGPQDAFTYALAGQSLPSNQALSPTDQALHNLTDSQGVIADTSGRKEFGTWPHKEPDHQPLDLDTSITSLALFPEHVDDISLELESFLNHNSHSHLHGPFPEDDADA